MSDIREEALDLAIYLRGELDEREHSNPLHNHGVEHPRRVPSLATFAEQYLGGAC